MTDLLTYRALVLLGEQEHEVGDHAASHQQLHREDAVHLADEATPDALIPKVEASSSLVNHFLKLF